MMPKREPDDVSAEVEEDAVKRPVDPRAEMVVVLAQQGVGRNEISRRTGIPAVTVSTIAKAHGLTFSRAKTEQALKARLTDLKVKQMGIAEGLNEDITFARVLLRTARTHRDYAFAAKAVSDLARAAKALTPEWSQGDELAEAKDFLVDLRKTLGKVRDGFETQYGVPFDSQEARRIIEQQEESSDG
ncbi:hypothetical protein [Streptomyces sudanensis]|uniref:hypothetical protein n=1 Tax=Streptomyces sudanensis TaxID=436397 RepID=UPI0020CD49E0|nr:hypothetical protein [Streptomyces sudanensis]MCP9957086.1 hypothetical protein [Streptomyces sudanensis]MCQ0002333.1 hypothetical protein [Streptomyces sudanensis]